MRRARAQALLAAMALVLSAAALGCSALGQSPVPSGACVDTRAPGTIPELEALLPKGMIERPPTTVDSGWNCSDRALGSYTAYGVRKLSFAGATWDNGGGDATVAAILASGAEGPPLQTPWVEEFYTIGALNGRNTDNVTTARPTMAGAGAVFRLETLNNLSLQTVVVWPAAPYVRVVIVATDVSPDASRADHDQRVVTAVEVAAAVPIR